MHRLTFNRSTPDESSATNPLSEAFNCPICYHASQPRFKKHGIWIRQCPHCRHCLAEWRPSEQHVAEVYGDHYFFGGAAGYPDYLREAALLRRQGRRYGQILRRYMPPGRVLDVGAAAGLILAGLQDSGWQVQGLEPNAQMAQYACLEVGVPVSTGTLEQFSAVAPHPDDAATGYDLVTMIQVVAHFHDLRRAFAVATQVTKPGGFWLIETWNRDSWTARLLGQHWHEYSPPSVLQWFSRSGLQDLAAQFGFRPVAQGRPTKWIGGAHAKSLLKHELQTLPLRRFTLPLVDLIPDRGQFPYPAEDLFWLLLQKVD